jgi:hypothetical protein
MAGGMSSGSISTVYVYPQDSEPATKRPGVLWVDTSVSPAVLKAYDSGGDSWTEVIPTKTGVMDPYPAGYFTFANEDYGNTNIGETITDSFSVDSRIVDAFRWEISTGGYSAQVSYTLTIGFESRSDVVDSGTANGVDDTGYSKTVNFDTGTVTSVDISLTLDSAESDLLSLDFLGELNDIGHRHTL